MKSFVFSGKGFFLADEYYAETKSYLETENLDNPQKSDDHLFCNIHRVDNHSPVCARSGNSFDVYQKY